MPNVLVGYHCEVEDFEKLRKINSEIYTDKPLSGDRRRDLANHMDAVLHSIQTLPMTSWRNEDDS